MATTCGTGSSSSVDTSSAVEDAARAARHQLGRHAPRLGVLFVSARHGLREAMTAAEAAVPGAEWVGCTTAGELTESGTTRGGVSVMLLAWEGAAHRAMPPRVLNGEVDALARSIRDELSPLDVLADKEGWTSTITVLLGHGLTPRFERLVTAVRRHAGMHHPIVGGGAADDRELSRSWVAVGRDTVEGGVAAVHVASARPWGIGIGQGARPRSERMTVTRSSGTRVYEIDGRPALELYRGWADQAGEPFDEAEVATFLVRNELGIYLFDDIVRIRAGLAVTDDGAIEFAGEVPEGSSVAIVRADREDLVEGARRAAEMARAGVDGEVAGVLVFSCVTRALVLDERTDEERQAIREVFGPDTPIAGFYTYSEVARVAGKLDGYHNHSVVVAAIPA